MCWGTCRTPPYPSSLSTISAQISDSRTSLFPQPTAPLFPHNLRPPKKNPSIPGDNITYPPTNNRPPNKTNNPSVFAPRSQLGTVVSSLDGRRRSIPRCPRVLEGDRNRISANRPHNVYPPEPPDGPVTFPYRTPSISIDRSPREQKPRNWTPLN